MHSSEDYALVFLLSENVWIWWRERMGLEEIKQQKAASRNMSDDILECQTYVAHTDTRLGAPPKLR